MSAENRLFSPVELADICGRAVKLLERDGWTQGGNGSDEETGSRCLVRALADAARETYGGGPFSFDAISDACLAVEARLDVAWTDGVVRWNDAKGRELEEIIDLLGRTERELREEAFSA